MSFCGGTAAPAKSRYKDPKKRAAPLKGIFGIKRNIKLGAARYMRTRQTLLQDLKGRVSPRKVIAAWKQTGVKLAAGAKAEYPRNGRRFIYRLKGSEGVCHHYKKQN